MITENKNEIENTVPFEDVEQAWFWFISAQKARDEGAKITRGEALLQRPCDPNDILLALNRLYKNRRINREHLLVLRHYGRRFLPPDLNYIKEERAYYIWQEAMIILEDVLLSKKIITKKISTI